MQLINSKILVTKPHSGIIVLMLSYLLTYLCPSTRWEHGPSIKALHRILRCAMVAISCQVYPIFLASDSTSRRQVFLGRPLFLFPWGFHVSACLVMLVVGFLNVWPIQRHFLRFISISTGSCCHSCYLSGGNVTLYLITLSNLSPTTPTHATIMYWPSW